MNFDGSHDKVLVALSILLAIFASFAALSLASRIRASSRRGIWLAASSLAMGGGIWSMHFIAMLAYEMPGMAMRYDFGLTLLSLGVALVFTGLGFTALYRSKSVTLPAIAGSGLLMGSGALAMHYIGMAAMQMNADLSFDGAWLSASVFIALGAATGAVWLASLDHKLSHRLAASVVMGCARRWCR